MKNKKVIMPIVVLVSICVVVAALLGAVNMLTAPKIEENAIRAEQEALFEVLSAEKDGFDAVKDLKGLPTTVSAVYKAKGGAGYVVSLVTTTSYSSGDMTVVVGIDNDGKVVGVKLNSYYESKDFGKETYPQSFIGKDYESYESVDTVSGVTYSSTAFRAVIGDALAAVKIANGEKVDLPDEQEKPELPKNYVREDSELLVLAGALIANADFEDVTPEEEIEYLRRLFRDKNGNGYVAYVLVMSQYGTPESEALIHIGKDRCVKNINRLVWKTSDAMYGYVPPSIEEVDKFYGRIPGSDVYSIDDVLHVTNATNTSGRVLDSFAEALEAVEELEKSYAPRIIGIIVTVLLIGAFITLFIFNRKRRAPYEK